MRRRIPWIMAVVVVLALSAILSGCGSKDATSIVKDLDKVMSKMESYQGSGTMTLHTGAQPLNYKVEVWYQKPNYYRIALTNEKRDITQIVLRNDDGVFVLTPSLNKSYRFQSDWPENQGQVYLYQTLVQSIQLDNSRQFTTDKDTYVFDVMAGNYQNGSFARQKIWLAKDDYAPRHVEVTDTNNNVMVEVKFDSFEFGKKFESSAFDMKSNMSGAPGGTGPQASDGQAADGQSVDGQTTDGQTTTDGRTTDGQTTDGQTTDGQTTDGQTNDGQTTDGQTKDGQSADEQTSAQPETPQNVTVVEPDPDALPEGVKLKDMSDVQRGESMGVMLRYTGTYDFTVLELVQKDQAAAAADGVILDLGFTVGQLSGDSTKTLTWSYGGVEYRLTTVDLPQEDMVRVAQSMVESSGK